MAMRNREDDGMITKVVSINRVSKTVLDASCLNDGTHRAAGDHTGTGAPSVTASASPAKCLRQFARARLLLRRICTRLP